jgi:hypothetical protein
MEIGSVIMRSWVQVLETASCKNAGKDCVHKSKNQSGQTLLWTLCKRELRAPGCPFSIIWNSLELTTKMLDFISDNLSRHATFVS